jgi:hypothetical protein
MINNKYKFNENLEIIDVLDKESADISWIKEFGGRDTDNIKQRYKMIAYDINYVVMKNVKDNKDFIYKCCQDIYDRYERLEHINDFISDKKEGEDWDKIVNSEFWVNKFDNIEDKMNNLIKLMNKLGKDKIYSIRIKFKKIDKKKTS